MSFQDNLFIVQQEISTEEYLLRNVTAASNGCSHKTRARVNTRTWTFNRSATILFFTQAGIGSKKTCKLYSVDQP